MLFLCITRSFLLQYKLEDFALFDNVVHINAADNQLPLGESVDTLGTLSGAVSCKGK